MNLKNIILSLLISLVCIGGYHFYLLKQGIFTPHIRGIYTINVNEALDIVKRKILEGAIQGKDVNVDDEIQKIQNALDKIAKRVPDGYILLPEDVVLGGKRKMINILNGKVSEKQQFEKKLLNNVPQQTQTKK